MTQFEIIMQTDTPELPAQIGNFAEVKAAISSALAQYSTDTVVDAVTVKDAEKTRAHLRKVKEQIETYRKDAKAAYLAKFSVLETQCRELSAMIEEPITAIDSKIKAFEDSENVKKYDEIMRFFATIPNRPMWLALDTVLNPKWKNKGMTLDKIKEELKETVKQINADFAELERLYKQSPVWTAIHAKFIETRSKSQTLVYAAELERQHSEEQKRADAIQQARTREEEQGAISTPETAQNAQNSVSGTGEKMLSGAFKVQCTKSALIALVQFMKDNGIQYSVIKN